MQGRVTQPACWRTACGHARTRLGQALITEADVRRAEG